MAPATGFAPQASRQAVTIEDAETVQFSMRDDDLIVLFRNGEVMPFGRLSDGYRTMLAMAADATETGVLLLNELGLYPGIDHMAAMAKPYPR